MYKSSINFITCTDALSDLTSDDIENKIKLSRGLSKMYISRTYYEKYGIKCLNLALTNGYFDILTYLASELTIVTFIKNLQFIPLNKYKKDSFSKFL